ncbi:MAG: sigma-70 family RNA polymerase sigma factor [Actinobacteria bacterium]|nr:sigma-70 family RNA polymerase sigma factor [Actinomycetota bacterium]
MDEGRGEGRGSCAAEELILRTVAAHANSLLRTARRHSICLDDAQDAYQRALEIFMTHADRLDPARAPGWLHVVVKREAQAIRSSRKKLVSSCDVDFDTHEARALPTPEERLLSFDLISRSAEALQRLKPQELRALWLKAQGHSYNDIGAITGWSYTKVNRCLTEGRRSFLERYAGIESGAECEHWMPVISAMVDGEATPGQILELRPHLRNCPGCRATLKALHDSSEPLSAVLPIPLIAATTTSHEHLSNLFMRAYEAVAGGVHERAVHSVTKAQAAMEAAAAGKVAAVAASAAAVAGGGYATVERTVRPAPQRAAVEHEVATSRTTPRVLPKRPTRTERPTATRRPIVRHIAKPRPQVNEFGQKPRGDNITTASTEFESTLEPTSAKAAFASSPAAVTPPPPPPPPPARVRPVAPEFAPNNGGDEFGP